MLAPSPRIEAAEADSHALEAELETPRLPSETPASETVVAALPSGTPDYSALIVLAVAYDQCLSVWYSYFVLDPPPPGVFVHGTARDRPLHDSNTGVVLYVDGARCLPSNVSVSKVVGRVSNRNKDVSAALHPNTQIDKS